MTIMPHNHRMWAVIGIYTGREDNVFWRRIADDPHGRVEAAGAKALCVRDAEPLGHNIIHSVTNPIPRLTGAIHVYGGDFFNVERSEWDPELLLEQPYDTARMKRRFEEANAGGEASARAGRGDFVPDLHLCVSRFSPTSTRRADARDRHRIEQADQRNAGNQSRRGRSR